jgi:hypothetical protein
VLMGYMQAPTEVLPTPSPFSMSDGSTLTIGQKILIAGVMHAMDQRRSSRMWQNKRGQRGHQRVVRAENCGQWAMLVWEYVGIRTPRGSRRFRPRGRRSPGESFAERNYYQVNGRWKASKRRGWSHLRDYDQRYTSQFQSVRPADFKSIKPGDWLMLKWAHTTGGANHSVIFIRWLDGDADARTRGALVMDQFDNNQGGGRFKEMSGGRNARVFDRKLSCDVRRTPYVYAIHSARPSTP